MGAISEAIARQRARPRRRRSARTRPSRRSTSRGGRVTGVTLESGEAAARPARAVRRAPARRTVLDLVGAEHFPDEVAEDMRRYRTRGGSVKVNAVLSEPPRYERVPRSRRARCCTRASRSARRSTTSSARGRTRTRGVPAEGPYIEVEVPTAIDPSLTDDGTTVLTMFTQYGPHAEEGWPDGAREAYAQRCFDDPRRSTRRTCRDAVVHYEVLAPPDLERIFGLVGGSIFQGEQGLDQMAFMRPSPLLSRYATPVARPLPVRRRHAPRRRRDRGRRPQRRPARAARPAARERAARRAQRARPRR